ncbi:MAG: AAA family ATPase [Azoarcus sp.]|jgi:predicted ATPase|nr:AAA family ATPase [Azoarcus sp.]
MFQRIYINNYRCFQNFDFKPKDCSSVLLIGKNGSGKSTLRDALMIFQKIGLDEMQLDRLIGQVDFYDSRMEIPIRFELEILINSRLFHYELAIDREPNNFHPCVLEENLEVNGEAIFSRQRRKITTKDQGNQEITLDMDVHKIFLPFFSTGERQTFQWWLKRIVLLSPAPGLMTGQATRTKGFDINAVNWCIWLSHLLNRHPAAYGKIEKILKQYPAMEDIDSFRFNEFDMDTKWLLVDFKSINKPLIFDFLSDGEKMYFLVALVLVSSEIEKPQFVFWDEPDAHLMPDEVDHFIRDLRGVFQRNGGQIFITSHHARTIRCFADENTWLLDRKNHSEPTTIRCAEELGSDWIQDYLAGELE